MGDRWSELTRGQWRFDERWHEAVWWKGGLLTEQRALAAFDNVLLTVDSVGAANGEVDGRVAFRSLTRDAKATQFLLGALRGGHLR